MSRQDEQPETAINTHCGHVIDFALPDPDQIDLADISWGLSRICRFGAQSLEFYSVAQHAVTVAQTVARLGHLELALAALHHDSHEAYCCDVPKPLKRLLGSRYTEITEAMDRAVVEGLGLSWPEKGSDEADLIKAVDDAALAIEGGELLPGWQTRTQDGGVESEILEAAAAPSNSRSTAGSSTGRS